MERIDRPRFLACACCVLLAAVGSVRAGADEQKGAPPQGALRFDVEEHDFGVVEQYKEYTADVVYRNAGTKPLERIRVKADCGCYAASLSADALVPGATGTLRVRFRTLGFSGLLRKTLRLAYEELGGTAGEAALPLKLSIFGGVVVYPGRLHFGDVLAGTLPEDSVTVVWYEGVGRPFEIRSVDVAGQPIETRVEPFADPARPRWKGWRVNFRFLEPPPRGVYSKRAVVVTTHPDIQRVMVPLTAHVVGKVWVQTHRVYLGLVRQGTAKSAWVAFRPFEPGIELGQVSARARKGVLTTSIEPFSGPAGPGQRLRVSVPANAPPGPLDDVVELRTQVAGEEVTEIEVRGRVFAP